MKNIALITNFNIHEKANAALTVAETLVGFGAKVLIASQNKDRIFRLHRNHREYVYLPLEELYREAEAIVVLGGDGSLLDAARRAAPCGKPLLGINMGHLGYMAELEMSEIALLERLVTDDYEVDCRAMLHVAVKRDGATIECYVNDVLVFTVSDLAGLSATDKAACAVLSFNTGVTVTNYSITTELN